MHRVGYCFFNFFGNNYQIEHFFIACQIPNPLRLFHGVGYFESLFLFFFRERPLGINVSTPLSLMSLHRKY